MENQKPFINDETPDNYDLFQDAFNHLDIIQKQELCKIIGLYHLSTIAPEEYYNNYDDYSTVARVMLNWYMAIELEFQSL